MEGWSPSKKYPASGLSMGLNFSRWAVHVIRCHVKRGCKARGVLDVTGEWWIVSFDRCPNPTQEWILDPERNPSPNGDHTS